jgi:predicted pyridoxine 5'-phosphate oxidase superfamily flavin-nucleotide-binding protein
MISAHKKLIERNTLALATIDKKGRPNVIGVAYARVVDKNKVLITDNFMTQTIGNIKHNSAVCIAVWDKKWNGLKLIGKAKYYSSGKWVRQVKSMKENKGLPAKGAILVSFSKVIPLK